MKFTNSLFILIAATSVYSTPKVENPESKKIITEEEIKNTKGEAYYNCYKFFKLVEKDCIPIEKDAYSKTKLDSLCDNFNKEKCQQLKNDPSAVLSECNNLDIYEFNDFKDFIDESFEYVQLYCTKNENGDYCPITNLSIFQGTTFEEYLSKNTLVNEIPSEEDLKKTMDETCKSNKCREAIIEAFKSLDDTVTIINAKRQVDSGDDVIDNLFGFYDMADTALNTAKSDKCIAVANNPNVNMTTGSSDGVNKFMIGYTIVIASILFTLSLT